MADEENKTIVGGREVREAGGRDRNGDGPEMRRMGSYVSMPVRRCSALSSISGRTSFSGWGRQRGNVGLKSGIWMSPGQTSAVGVPSNLKVWLASAVGMN